MQISRDVILDLLTLYQVNEASEDTKILIKTWLAEHPEDADRFKRSQSLILPETLPPTKGNHEMTALAKTKFYLRMRTFLFASAIFMSCMPFAFGDTSFDDVEGIHWLWLNNPTIAVAFATLAITLWIAYFILSKKLKVTGL